MPDIQIAVVALESGAVDLVHCAALDVNRSATMTGQASPCFHRGVRVSSGSGRGGGGTIRIKVYLSDSAGQDVSPRVTLIPQNVAQLSTNIPVGSSGCGRRRDQAFGAYWVSCW
jgi:hypothetical protein